MNKELPQELKSFVNNTSWRFATTYANTWPHYYLVRDKVDKRMFYKLAQHIRTYGYDGKFYSRYIRYFNEDGWVYWTMVKLVNGEWDYPLEETMIINRVQEEDSYEYKRDNGLLQPSKKGKSSNVPKKTNERNVSGSNGANKVNQMELLW